MLVPAESPLAGVLVPMGEGADRGAGEGRREEGRVEREGRGRRQRRATATAI